ncbi:vacuolar protein sorting-associated protein 35 [Halteromyces radiatus]|uniref:vacuolar protein sorting-associated protein 35 n=1 Tax=Halteromyces radiatus TaxID=101107 RepID=UPI00221EEBA9|nr:vacuolar protein sorting-associated protein 35 [Halteromyces radiatus]KAI8099631.1 vacuolar protein sorting-associated protein 35 [Halteromyces radiatus]
MNYTNNNLPVVKLEDQSKLLDTILNTVKIQSHHMRNCLNENKLMDGLKYASNMLAELRTSNLTPKSYYQLYMAIFDSLRHLTAYFVEVHQTERHHLADLYELVQYAGNIIPRLYLMITVGAAYMSMPDAPVREIMRDMMEMARGVQHPMRGLFLRYYLCALTRDHLPVCPQVDVEANIHESIRFTLTNFIEMNKLWIRLQHHGHSRDREKRDIERRELRILVGTNLERLSQLDGVDLKIYKSAILPELLNEAVNCRDVLAQEYLMDIIIQVFPDEFHLHTLEPFLNATAQLHPKVNIKLIIIALIDRLTAYAARETEMEMELEKQRLQSGESVEKRNVNTKQRMDTSESTHTNSTQEAENTKSDDKQLPSDDHLETDTNNKETLTQTEGDTISNKDIDHNTDNVEQQCEETDVARNKEEDADNDIETIRGIPKNVELFAMFWQRIVVLVKARPDLTIEDITELLVSLINLCLSCYPNKLEYVDQILLYCKEQCTEHANSNLLYSKTTENHLMTLLSAPIQQYESTLTLLMLENYGSLLQQQPYNTRRRLALAMVTNVLAKGTIIDTPEEVHNILELCDVLLRDQKDVTGHYHGGQATKSHHSFPPMYEYEDSLSEEQGAIAKLIHLFRSDDDDTQFLLLSATRRQLNDGGKRIRFTFPSLITASLKLSRRYQIQNTKGDIWEKKTTTLYRFIDQVITILYTNCEETADQCLRFYLMAGQSANTSGFEEMAYDFFVQGFSVYEESISDSKAQFQAITYIIGALHQATANGFTTDHYNILIAKAAVHGSKLLKKPDQCRAVYMASHLWWKINKDGDDGDNKRTLECLQKALKIADSCMDMITTLELFVEILNQCIYYYGNDDDAITAEYVNGLIDMIHTHLSNLDDADLYPFTSSSSSLLQYEGTSMAEHMRRHFMSTLQQIKLRQDPESENKKFNSIVVTVD